MNERLRRWWRYPFAFAGPVSVGYCGAVALAGALGALTLAPGAALLPGAVAFFAGSFTVARARKRFAAKRELGYSTRNRAGRLRHEILGVVVAVLALLVVAGFHLNPGWLWMLFAAGMFGVEFDRRQTWARAGYPSDPRAARDWSPDKDPAHEWFGLSRLLAADYTQAIDLLRRGLETKPGDRAILYNLACAEALTGDSEAALGHLQEAVKDDPERIERARKDPDFASIKNDSRFPAAGSR